MGAIFSVDVFKGLSENAHKKLRFLPGIVFIDGT